MRDPLLTPKMAALLANIRRADRPSFALRSGAAAVALDYRLAPEHRFPRAVADAWAAIRWLIAHARGLGLRLRQQLLVTPGTMSHADTPSRRFGQGYLLDANGMAWVFDQYIAHAERRDWRFAPLEADELELTRGVTHDFIKMGRALPEAAAAQSFIGASLRHALDLDLDLDQRTDP